MYSLLSLPGSSRKGEIMPNKHKLLSSFLSGTVPKGNAVKKGLYGEGGEKMVEEKRGDEMKKNYQLFIRVPEPRCNRFQWMKDLDRDKLHYPPSSLGD